MSKLPRMSFFGEDQGEVWDDRPPTNIVEEKVEQARIRREHFRRMMGSPALILEAMK